MIVLLTKGGDWSIAAAKVYFGAAGAVPVQFQRGSRAVPREGGYGVFSELPLLSMH